MKRLYLFFFLLFMGGNCLYAQADRQTSRKTSTVYQKERDSLKNEWKGSYLSISGTIGSSAFHYKLNSLGEKGNRKGGLGYGIDLRYSYFFNPHWGVTTGVGFSYYGTTGKLQGSLAEEPFYNLGKLTDDDWQPAPKDFELRARITHLKEKQTTYLLDIPLMISYQTYFGDSANWGIYGGLGAKLQFPVSSKFKIRDGAKSELNISGQYDGIPTDMGSPANPPVPQHGYGTISDPNSSLDWDDKAKLKMGIAATAELGVMFDIGKGMDLMIGGYMDYGLNNMKKKGKQGLFTAPAVYHPGADSKVGSGIGYNGMLNSDVTGKVRLISFGGKLTLRFQL